MSLKKFFLKKILRRKYIRKGSCKGCGSCCRQIYVKHAKFVIKSKEFFEALQEKHSFYKGLTPLGEDEIGLYFACNNLDLETNRCKIHKTRPGICRRYPCEEIFSMGGEISENCGYSFVPIDTFSDVLAKVISKSKRKQD